MKHLCDPDLILQQNQSELILYIGIILKILKSPDKQ